MAFTALICGVLVKQRSAPLPIPGAVPCLILAGLYRRHGLFLESVCFTRYHAVPPNRMLRCGTIGGTAGRQERGMPRRARGIEAKKEPGMYGDGGAHDFPVEPTGAECRSLRTVIHCKRCKLGISGADLVSFSEMRAKAAELRKAARTGGDQSQARPLVGKRSWARSGHSLRPPRCFERSAILTVGQVFSVGHSE